MDIKLYWCQLHPKQKDTQIKLPLYMERVSIYIFDFEIQIPPDLSLSLVWKSIYIILKSKPKLNLIRR